MVHAAHAQVQNTLTGAYARMHMRTDDMEGSFTVEGDNVILVHEQLEISQQLHEVAERKLCFRLQPAQEGQNTRGFCAELLPILQEKHAQVSATEGGFISPARALLDVSRALAITLLCMRSHARHHVIAWNPRSSARGLLAVS